MPIHMSSILFPTEMWVMFTWSRALPFMITSTLIRQEQTHRHLVKSQPVYQSSSDEFWTSTTVSSVNQSAPLYSLNAGNVWQNNDLWLTSMRFQHPKSIYKKGLSDRSKSTLICWSVYKLGWTGKAAEWNAGDLNSQIQAESRLHHEDLWSFPRPEHNRLWNNPGPHIHHARVWQSPCSPCTNRYV